MAIPGYDGDQLADLACEVIENALAGGGTILHLSTRLGAITGLEYLAHVKGLPRLFDTLPHRDYAIQVAAIQAAACIGVNMLLEA